VKALPCTIGSDALEKDQRRSHIFPTERSVETAFVLQVESYITCTKYLTKVLVLDNLLVIVPVLSAPSSPISHHNKYNSLAYHQHAQQ
jgi:hypothetical protein